MKLRAYNIDNDRFYYSEDYADMSLFFNECEALLSAGYEVIYQHHIRMADKYNCDIYEGMEVEMEMNYKLTLKGVYPSFFVKGVIKYFENHCQFALYNSQDQYEFHPISGTESLHITKEKGF